MQFLPSVFLIIFLSCSANRSFHDEQRILQNIILYSQHSQLLDSCDINPNSYADWNDFAQQHSDEISNAYMQTVEICTDLELESQACFEDCIYYVSPLTLLLNTSTYNQTKKIFNWYQMGGGPIGWFETGDPDMCAFTDGTYCFTPISDLQQHGCCVPGSCVGEDAVKVLQENVWCYQGYNITYAQHMYEANFSITNRCEPIPRDFSNPGFYIVVILFCMLAMCVIMASVMTQYLAEQQLEDDNNNNCFLYCFSIQNTWKIFNSRRPENKSEFNFLDGLRFVSMVWVVWGHVHLFWCSTTLSGKRATANLDTFRIPSADRILPQGAMPDDYPYVFNKLYMMFAEYDFSVETFFFISGFLGAFSLHRQLQKYDRHKAFRAMYIWIPLAYLHRILRLLPMIVFVLLLQMFIFDQIPYGYKVDSRVDNYEMCAKSWYKILLFYASMDKRNEGGCLGQLWYVNVDMMLFLLLPWVMLLFKWNTLLGIFASLVPFFVCIGIRTFFAIYYHFGANSFYKAHEEINGGEKTLHYFLPPARMAPYYFGTFTMLTILTLKTYKFEIRSRLIYFCVMGLSCFIMLSLVFWPWADIKNAPRDRWNLVSNQIYYALSRPAWGVALGLLSFVLVFKCKYFKSMIGTILSLEIYQSLAKLTYTMYLIHLLVLSWFFSSVNSPFYYELWLSISIFMAALAVTLGLTIILWFVVEQPMANMVGLCMKRVFVRKGKPKQIMDAELLNMTETKRNNTNGNDVIDKLLVKGGASQDLHLAKGSFSGVYESFSAVPDGNACDFSMKSNQN